MERYIDVELVKENFAKRLACFDGLYVSVVDVAIWFGNSIKETLADAVEVVRCKDCQYRYTINCNAKHEIADMDFCSHGIMKRRNKNAVD